MKNHRLSVNTPEQNGSRETGLRRSTRERKTVKQFQAQECGILGHT